MSMARRTVAILALSALVGCAAKGVTQVAPGVMKVTLPKSDIGIEMVRIPGGTFRLAGPGGGQIDVTVKPFWISRHEITWSAFRHYVEAWRLETDGVVRPTQPDVIMPWEPFPSGVEQGGTHPAVAIGWHGAVGFCDFLSHWTKKSFRLPTEVEWAYACSKAPQVLDDVAWHEGNSGKGSHAVGTKKPNAWGLYDMLGNAWEICLEPFDPSDFLPALRGGAWNTKAAEVRPDSRIKPDQQKWMERDPKRPLRAWWYTDAPVVGFRIVYHEEAGHDVLKAAAGKVEIRNLTLVNRGKRPDFMARVTGEVAYSGDRPLGEVEVLIYYLNEEGHPIGVEEKNRERFNTSYPVFAANRDPKEKPCFVKAYPVLASSFHSEAARKPLVKGGVRTFEAFIPHPFDEVGPLDLKEVGAKVSRVRFAGE